MTGPEHYREAEKHLNTAVDTEPGSPTERYNLAAAQVHATLAQVAATITHAYDTHPGTDSSMPIPPDWDHVLNEGN